MASPDIRVIDGLEKNNETYKLITQVLESGRIQTIFQVIRQTLVSMYQAAQNRLRKTKYCEN